MILRKPHPVVKHNHLERWLLTYADMITLLTAFFLMLYSMSVMSKGKFQLIATSVRSGFGTAVTPGGQGILPNARSNTPAGTALSASAYQNYQEAMRELDRFVEQHRLGGQVNVHNESRGIVISLLSDGLLFERGRASLQPSSSGLLERVGRAVRPLPNPIQVEGHTCNLPIHTTQFPSNWELSTARAGTVLRYLTDRAGVAADRLAAAGYAETRPLVANDTEAHRARNRRVDIVILKTDAQHDADRQREAEIRRITVQ